MRHEIGADEVSCSYLRIRPGADATNGTWKTVERGTQANLERLDPGLMVTEILGYPLRADDLCLDDFCLGADHDDAFTFVE